MIKPYIWFILIFSLASILIAGCSVVNSLDKLAPILTPLPSTTQASPTDTLLGTTVPSGILGISTATPTPAARTITTTPTGGTGVATGPVRTVTTTPTGGTGVATEPVRTITPTPTAGTGVPPGTARTITVDGQGSASGAPDIAQVNVGVQVVGETVSAATAENNQKITAVIAKLKSLGIADSDIQTTNFSVYPQRGSSSISGQEGAITGYQVSNNVQVTVRDLNNIGAILDGAIQAGANDINGITYGVSSPAKLQSQARVQAITDAQARADDLARLAGVQRGDVISMNETTTYSPVPMGGGGLAAARSDVPVQPGQIESRVVVQITYAIR
jgi:uncharacterized protein